MKCKKCTYGWDYTGKLILATCPSCGTKNKVKNVQEN